MDQYSAKSKSYSQELGKKKYNTISLFRLLCIVLLGSLYYYIQDSGIVFWFLLLYFYRFYSFNANSLQVAFERKINTALKEINENEILFREENHSIW
jgi:hypothetical protein